MSERDGYEPGVPCWVDTWQPEAAAAARFYTAIFGWEVAEGPEYAMCRLRGRDVAGIGSPPPPGVPPAWTTYVWVESAEATAAKAAAGGGRLVGEPFESLDGGRMAIVADPAGAVLGVWQPGEHSGAQVVNEPGAWAMSMLSTPDREGAEAFYGAVFGWGTETFDGMTLLRLPGYVGGEPQQPVPRDVIAVILPPSDAPPHWQVNFWIADADAAAQTTAELGGEVIVRPFDTPGFRNAVLTDPAGAVFSVSRLLRG